MVMGFRKILQRLFDCTKDQLIKVNVCLLSWCLTFWLFFLVVASLFLVGHSTAQNNLGYCCQYGQGCEKNLNEAVLLYEASAGQGCSFGQNSLGHCYKRGHGVPKDYAKAVYYYRLSAEQGQI
jgi:TPR repeat protein